METVLPIEPEVWTALMDGDKAAYATVYRTYFTKFYNYGFKFTNNTSLIEDCIQETLSTFWINREKHKLVDNLDAYLHVCFRNGLIRSLQLLQNERTHTSALDFDIVLSIDQVMINAERLYEQQVSLDEALLQLTPRQKEAIYLKYFENMSYEHIADVLSISTKATYKLVARAVAELRTVYTQKIVSR